MSRIDDWNLRHRVADHASMDPAPIVVEAANRIRPGRALDLASGKGRNAKYLSMRGWDVVTIDASTEVRPRVIADLERDHLPFGDGSFDLIVNVFFLHRPLFAEVRRVLKPGGVFAAQIHLRGINPAFCVKPGELRERFADWEIVAYREGDTAGLIVRHFIHSNT